MFCFVFFTALKLCDDTLIGTFVITRVAEIIKIEVVLVIASPLPGTHLLDCQRVHHAMIDLVKSCLIYLRLFIFGCLGIPAKISAF